MVILDRQDYVNKVENISHDSTKYKKIVPASIWDKINKIQKENTKMVTLGF